jgi:predicted nucleic acid-binding protein
MSKRVYLDSCVLISFLQNESGRADTVEAALRSAKNKGSDIEFVTSALAITEVAYLTDAAGLLEGDIQAIDDFWDTSGVQFVEINRINAAQARDLLRSRARQIPNIPLSGGRRRAADALHLASAIALPCTEFWTYDTSDFLRYGVSAVRICEPYTEQLGLPFGTISGS